MVPCYLLPLPYRKNRQIMQGLCVIKAVCKQCGDVSGIVKSFGRWIDFVYNVYSGHERACCREQRERACNENACDWYGWKCRSYSTSVVSISMQARNQEEKDHAQEPADDVGTELPGGIPDPGSGLPISPNYASVKILSNAEMVVMAKWAQCGEACKDTSATSNMRKKKGTLLTG